MLTKIRKYLAERKKEPFLRDGYILDKEPCNNCGNTTPFARQTARDQHTKKLVCVKCDKCGLHQTNIPDVYFKEPYFDPNLANKQNQFGQMVNSRTHKAELLKQNNLVEAGDRPNKTLGKRMPYIKDVQERQKFYKENFGG